MKKICCKLSLLFFIIVLTAMSGCKDGIDDWNSSAKVIGDVYTDPSHTQGVGGVRVIIESPSEADNPYKGADRWAETAGNGHFEKSVFLGNSGTNVSGSTNYNWIADLSVSYFWHNKAFSWTGGISVSPGSSFTLPAIDTTMFMPIVSTQ
jgi:hypothetical protein